MFHNRGEAPASFTFVHESERYWLRDARLVQLVHETKNLSLKYFRSFCWMIGVSSNSVRVDIPEVAESSLARLAPWRAYG